MNEFVYLYRRSATPTAPSPQQMQERMQRWSTWLKELEKKGHVVSIGHPLEAAGAGAPGKGTVSDGPYAETKDIVIGYSLIRASSLAEASALAAGCPVF